MSVGHTGVEDEVALELQTENIRGITELVKQFKDSNDTLEKLISQIQISLLLKEHVSISRERSRLSSEIIACQMDKSGMTNAGLLFGDGHYQDFAEDLRKKEIGHAFFWPGKVKVSADDVFNYMTGF